MTKINELLEFLYRNYYIYILIISSFFILSSFNSKIDTNELWMFSESYLNSIGAIPYHEYFSHRMPLHQFIYGKIIAIFSTNLFLITRLFSTFISTLSLIIIFYIAKKITKNSIVFFCSFLIFLSPIYLYSASLNLIYPIVNFLFSLTILFFYLFRNYLQLGIVTFFLIQILIYLSQYLISSQLILIYFFLFFTFYFYPFKSIKIFVVLITIIITSLLILSFVFKHNLVYQTFTYNINQINQFLEKSIIDDLKINFQTLFLTQRINEIKYLFFPILLILYISIFLISHNLKLLKYWDYKSSWKMKSLLYSLIYIFGFYFAFFFTGYDYPITKAYTFYPLFIVMCILINDLNFMNIKKIISIKLILLIVFFLIPPFYFNTSYVKTLFKPSDDIKELNLLNEYLSNNYKDLKLFSLNPLNISSNTKFDIRYSMELYSLLHNLNSDESNIHNLGNFENLIMDLKNSNYDVLVIPSKRYKIKKYMSKIFIPYYALLEDIINSNYEIDKIYKKSTIDEIIIYKKKEIKK